MKKAVLVIGIIFLIFYFLQSKDHDFRVIWMIGNTTFYPEVKLFYWDTFVSWFS